jgi:plastocyanin
MHRGRRAALAMIATAAVAAAIPAAIGASQHAAAKPKQHVVRLYGLSFSPRTIVAKPGDTVRFVWVQGVHNVVSSSGPARVNSGAPAGNDSLIITLKRGTYRLLCVPHAFAGMKMTIRVR